MLKSVANYRTHVLTPKGKFMHVLERFLQSLGVVRHTQPTVELTEELLPLLERIAQQEGKSIQEMAQDLLYQAIVERETAVANLHLWEDLTPREKQTAALACLGYTNHEIADRMVISPNTVKTHMRSVLHKINVSSKTDLRNTLAGWDFTDWVQYQNLEE
jgi:DNA-binding CsgD family transcriptional regulator